MVLCTILFGKMLNIFKCYVLELKLFSYLAKFFIPSCLLRSIISTSPLIGGGRFHCHGIDLSDVLGRLLKVGGFKSKSSHIIWWINRRTRRVTCIHVNTIEILFVCIILYAIEESIVRTSLLISNSRKLYILSL